MRGEDSNVLNASIRHQATYKSYIDNHKQSVHMGQKFQCPECEHKSSYKSCLVKHKKSVHVGLKFQCPECEYQAAQKGNLAIHQQLFAA